MAHSLEMLLMGGQSCSVRHGLVCKCGQTGASVATRLQQIIDKMAPPLFRFDKVVEISRFRRPNDSSPKMTFSEALGIRHRTGACVTYFGLFYATHSEPLLFLNFPLVAYCPWFTDQLRWQVRATGACCRGQASNRS